MKYRKALVLFSLFAMNLVDQSTVEVEIEQGKLTGIVSVDGTILEYIGIPYATVNSSNRFQAPYPAPKWDGVYKATSEYACAQKTDSLGVIGSEDCLKVNVYVPALTKKPLPVMVFIHGGAFILGSGGKLLYGPEFLVRHDIILVTFNYRLGVLGFLCLGIEAAPGNAGIKDQIAALRWVKKNIAAFGGDPDNVTIFGESAGATSASLLLASKATDGLFKQVIIQSGSSVSNWAVNRKPLWIASLLAKALGHDTEDPYELYEIFSKIPYKELLSVKATKPLDLFFDTQLLHLPCVEKQIPGVEAAIDDLPYNLLSNRPKDVSVIYGSNTKEGLFLLSEETEKTLEEKNFKYLFASDLEFPSDAEAADVDKKVKQFYFGDDRVSMAKKMNVSTLYTDLYFEIPEIIESEILLNNSKAPVYNYIFNYSGGRNFLKHRSGFANETGACHADDLLYLFTGFIWPFRVNEEDQKIVDWMTKMWTNFAKYGNPTPPTAADLPVRWMPSRKGEHKFLHIDKELTMGPMPNPEAYRLWNDIYLKYRKKDLKHYL